MKNKKERTYWGIKESNISEELLNKIKKYEQISTSVSCLVAVCCSLFLVLFCCKNYLSKAAFLACAIIFMLLSLCALVTEIIVATRLGKIKKQVLAKKKEDLAKEREEDDSKK